MRKDMKRIQQELERQTIEYSHRGGRIVVEARGDMSIKSVKIAPESVSSGNVEQLEELIVAGVNGALKSAKKQAGNEMSKLTAGMGLGDLMG